MFRSSYWLNQWKERRHVSASSFPVIPVLCSTDVTSCFLSSQHSLAVVKAQHLRWLGLRSLKEVSAGRVMMKDNTQLCYTRPDQWTRLFRSSDQTVVLRNNAEADLCGEFPQNDMRAPQKHPGGPPW